AIDIFVDQYYDNEEMDVLKQQYGVRHRYRETLSDEESDKNGRELLQVKINGIDGNELNRAEYKYEIQYYRPPTKTLDMHPFFYNIKRNQRQLLDVRLAEFNIVGKSLFPTIRIEQTRKRVYVSLRGE